MTNLRTIILILLLPFYGFLGCGPRQIEKNIVMDVSKNNQIRFTGMRGEEVSLKLHGVFSGKIKMAMVSNANKLTAKNFTVYKDSINVDLGSLKIYQDNTGFTWHILPIDSVKGSIDISIKENRKRRMF